MNNPVGDKALESWISLNDHIMQAGKEECERLLKIEKANRKRKQFISRIHSRLNKVRADQERKDLGI